jgi:hypothetical protein
MVTTRRGNAMSILLTRFSAKRSINMPPTNTDTQNPMELLLATLHNVLDFARNHSLALETTIRADLATLKTHLDKGAYEEEPAALPPVAHTNTTSAGPGAIDTVGEIKAPTPIPGPENGGVVSNDSVGETHS